MTVDTNKTVDPLGPVEKEAATASATCPYFTSTMCSLWDKKQAGSPLRIELAEVVPSSAFVQNVGGTVATSGVDGDSKKSNYLSIIIAGVVFLGIGIGLFIYLKKRK